MMSETVVHNKLVRDKILDIIAAAGKSHQSHIADDKEYQAAVYAKIIEEINEFKENPCIEEAADILEIVNSLFFYHGFRLEDIERARKDKEEKRGGFQKRIVLEKVIG